ncbi:hypothetical protein COCCU_01625 [Corynebacterium occultum]|uniref:TadE-like protein n=2 Tax=Corynebacterium occultum TaxID=2675219 RepID=A0A6B8W4F3_9CORY|nr:hypothetical protein [Corynebacterium occultum]QGU06285.1 hypothetical protein COCCU_01625 [Corynebacterium occultum]
MPHREFSHLITRALRNQQGSVTIEAALGLSSLVIVCAAMIGGIATLAAQVAAIDSAGAAARSQAIGVDYEPPRGSVSIHTSDGLLTATAEIPAIFGPVQATAIYPVETP